MLPELTDLPGSLVFGLFFCFVLSMAVFETICLSSTTSIPRRLCLAHRDTMIHSHHGTRTILSRYDENEDENENKYRDAARNGPVKLKPLLLLDVRQPQPLGTRNT